MDILSGINVSGNSKFYGDFVVNEIYGVSSVSINGSFFSSSFKSGSYNISRIPLITDSNVNIPSGCSSFHVPGVGLSSISFFIDAFATQECGTVLKTVKVDSKIVCGDNSPIITVVPKDHDWSLNLHVLHV